MTFDTTILIKDNKMDIRNETAERTIELVAGEKLESLAKRHEMPTADELAVLESPYALKKLLDRLCSGIKTVTACP